jgi:hypothetical protein
VPQPSFTHDIRPCSPALPILMPCKSLPSFPPSPLFSTKARTAAFRRPESPNPQLGPTPQLNSETDFVARNPVRRPAAPARRAGPPRCAALALLCCCCLGFGVCVLKVVLTRRRRGSEREAVRGGRRGRASERERESKKETESAQISKPARETGSATG